MKVLHVALVAILFTAAAAPPTAASAQYPVRRSLSSLKGGSFYVSKSKGDGVVELSQCQPFPGKSLARLKAPFFCTPDGAGFRCTSDRTRDVLFVFDSSRECAADRERARDSEKQ